PSAQLLPQGPFEGAGCGVTQSLAALDGWWCGARWELQQQRGELAQKDHPVHRLGLVREEHLVQHLERGPQGQVEADPSDCLAGPGVQPAIRAAPRQSRRVKKWTALAG